MLIMMQTKRRWLEKLGTGKVITSQGIKKHYVEELEGRVGK